MNGKSFKVQNHDDFSRSAIAAFTQQVGTKTAQWFTNHRDKELSVLGEDALLTNGANEIDALGTSDDRTQAFIECKSGGARSGGAQTSSYMQACTE